MNRWTVLLAALLMATFIAMGCSSGGGNPTAPTANPDLTGSVSHVGQAQTHLWGYYDVYIDIESQSVEAVLNRMCMFTANVTSFVNAKPSNLAFKIHGTPVTTSFVDVNIDVSITHPFPSMPQYNGYDVKGIFMGPGSSTMKYSSKCKYAKYGTDQSVWDFNPDGSNPSYIDPYKTKGATGNPDGYTRWFNAKEFTFPGLMGYTQGSLATPGYQAKLTATVNPYKYFADGLNASDDLWTWLNANPTKNGTFKSGSKNTRNYYLRFPNANGVKYGYAVAASWINETTHPANAFEAAGLSVYVTPDVYYVDGTDSGGDLVLDVNVWGWDYQPSVIKVESTVLSALHTFDATEMTPTGGDANYSAYHCEIPADAVAGTEGNQFWVIGEYDSTYTCSLTPPGGAPVAILAAYFRYDLFVANVPYNKPPVINSGVTGNIEPLEFTTEIYNVDATDADGDPITYTWTVYDADSNPVAGYDGVAGDGAGNLDVDFGAICGWTQGTIPFSIACVITDGINDPVDATTLDVDLLVQGDWWVSNHPDFASVPKYGTRTNPFSTIAQAIGFCELGQTIVVDYGTGTYNGAVSKSYSTGFKLRGWSWYTKPAGRPKITNSGLGRLVDIQYTHDVTIQGFKFEIYPGTGSAGYQVLYIYYSNNFKLIDCYLTGTISYYYLYAVYAYYSNNLTIKNCLFSDLNTSYPAYTYAYFYLYIYNYGGTGTMNFVQNELTKIQETPQVPGYMYFNMYFYYLPNGSKFSNNLFHHISPNVLTYASLYGPRIYYPMATVTVANNVMDKWDVEKGQNLSSSYIYGLYLYGASPTYGYDANSNIVTNMNGTKTLPWYYGIFAYNTSPDYNDVWNIQDIAYPSSLPGPNSISADPLFVNNTTEPYDYHLGTGSPCIDTGKAGVDMGCYGNLPAGETVVGLLTPK